jgi:hypothetical protein
MYRKFKFLLKFSYVLFILTNLHKLITFYINILVLNIKKSIKFWKVEWINFIMEISKKFTIIAISL